MKNLDKLIEQLKNVKDKLSKNVNNSYSGAVNEISPGVSAMKNERLKDIGNGKAVVGKDPTPEEVNRQLMHDLGVEKRELTTHARERIKDKNFAIPNEDAYPIEDKSHARNALSRVSANGTPEEKEKVRHAVDKKYPGMEEHNKDTKKSDKDDKSNAESGEYFQLFKNGQWSLHKKHIGFKNLEHKLEDEGHDKESAGKIAYHVGEEKYGKKGMEEKAHKAEDGKPNKGHSVFNMEHVNQVMKMPHKEAKALAHSIVNASTANDKNKKTIKQMIDSSKHSAHLGQGMSNHILAHPSEGLKVLKQ